MIPITTRDVTTGLFEAVKIGGRQLLNETARLLTIQNIALAAISIFSIVYIIRNLFEKPKDHHKTHLSLLKEATRKTINDLYQKNLSRNHRLAADALIGNIEREAELMIAQTDDKEVSDGILKAAKRELRALFTPRNIGWIDWRVKVENLIRKSKRENVEDEFRELINNSFHDTATNFNFIGGSILHVIAGHNASKLVALAAADRRIQPDLQDGWGNTALLWAIANAHNETAMELIELPQNFNLRGFGNTALELVIAKGYTDRDADGRELKFSNFEVMKKLIEKGANVNTKNFDGNSPLHLAYLRGDKEMIDYLIKSGANQNALNNKNETPARVSGNPNEIFESIAKVFKRCQNSA